MKKNFWTPPWGYAQGCAIALGVIAVSIALEALPHRVVLLSGASSVLFVIGFTAGLIMLARMFGRTAIVRYFSSTNAAVVAIGAFLVIIIAMGLIPQAPDTAALSPLPWLVRIKYSFVFFAVNVLLLIVLGLTAIRRLMPFSVRSLGFFVSHAGLYLVIIGMTAGSGDHTQVKLVTHTKDYVWYGDDQFGRPRELPLAVKLDRFDIAFYPPRLAVIDGKGKTHTPGRANAPLTNSIHRIGMRDVRVIEYLPAAFFAGGVFRSVHMPGAAPAAFVMVSNRQDGSTNAGWISCGSSMQERHTMELPNGMLALVPGSPRRFISEVSIFTASGQKAKATIAVNKPFAIMGYMLYQTGYDERMGEYSDISIIQAVRDPWLPVVYAGALLLVLGALYLIAVRLRAGKGQ